MRTRREYQEIEITVDSIGLEGVSVGRIGDLVHFVSGALPGERVRARVIRKKKNFVEAAAIEILEPSPHRQQAPCPHFGVCGGCKWQHFHGSQQTLWKRNHVVDAFERIARIAVGEIRDTLTSPLDYRYRNKMEFSFGASKWLTRSEIDSGEDFDVRFALGLHVPGRFDKVRHIESCLLHADAADAVLAHTHRCAQNSSVRAYHQRLHTGFARHLVLRTSATTGSVMAILITTTPTEEAETVFVNEWLSAFSGLPRGSSMIHAVNDSHSPVAVGHIVQTLGPGYLDETSNGVTFRISPFSFFQTNTHHLPALVEEAIEGAAVNADSVVWDLYCGTGTLTLPAARSAKHVLGAELSAGSISDAKQNAERNGITNVELHVLDLHKPAAISVLKSFATPNVIMIDPPRSGMHEQVVRHIMEVAPPRVVYVSCNPATMARDCAILAEMYDVARVTPVDMFPQTYHVEAVGVLIKR